MWAVLTLTILTIVHVTHGSSCDPKGKACTRHLAPVCATFKKTFSNRCMMESELCKLAQQGFHFDGDEGDNTDCCDGPMPLMYDPVCASDGKTYDNLWAMDQGACSSRDVLTEMPSNHCPDFPTTHLGGGGGSGGGWGWN